MRTQVACESKEAIAPSGRIRAMTTKGVEREPATEFVRSVDILGHRMAYFDRGTGPVLVLIHGMFGDHLDWEPVLEPLSASFRVLAVDLPGFGGSDKPDIEYTVEFFARALDAFLDSQHVDECILVGNSFGGEIASFYAQKYPDRVRALVLVSSAGMRLYTEDEQRLVTQKFSEATLLKLTPYLHEFLFAPIFVTDNETRRRYVEKQNAKLVRPDYPSYTRVLAQCGKQAFEIDTVSILESLSVPTLLVWGDKDVVFPASQAEAALQRLPNARLILVPDAGHVPQLENPTCFVNIIESFVQELA